MLDKLKESLSKPFAQRVVAQTKRWSSNPFEAQKKVFGRLIKVGSNTAFGKQHNFNSIKSYKDFKEQVPISDYESLKPYIERVKSGESNVLWKGRPLYLSKTSGTTSGVKYIPITKESIRYQVSAARDSILHYIAESGNTSIVSGKMIFLQGSPVLDYSAKIPTGRLSGIVAHHVPSYLLKNRLPSFETNSIEDWESKVRAICRETLPERMTLISGIPPWVQMYFEMLLKISGKKTVKELFPEFQLFIYGGVNYMPYKKNMDRLIGGSIDTIELYPASEGFIAYQDSREKEGMLLLLNSGIFYEFIPAEEFFEENPSRIAIEDVELDKNYVILLTTNAGLWAYNLGDMVRFVSLKPYRVVVSGRIKHYTSAFGEHVIAEEVEKAVTHACSNTGSEVVEFHLAPQLNPENNELPYHQWLVEFKGMGKDCDQFAEALQSKMMELNTYYKDLIDGKMLQPLKVVILPQGSFTTYMKNIGKLGGQNKLPRLSNDRKIADELLKQL